MDFAERLKFLRESNNLTQEQVSKAIGKTRSAYAYYESGTVQPKIETIDKLARIYNLTPDELIRGVLSKTENELNATEPKYEKSKRLDEKFYQLSEYEQSLLLDIRVMTIKEKKEVTDLIEKIKKRDK